VVRAGRDNGEKDFGDIVVTKRLNLHAGGVLAAASMAVTQAMRAGTSCKHNMPTLSMATGVGFPTPTDFGEITRFIAQRLAANPCFGSSDST
jgi:hypothetical protein